MEAVEPGHPHPLGARPREGGVSFSVFSRGADRVELLLYDRADDPSPARVIQLDQRRHHTHHYWHVFVPGLEPGQVYGYRAHGPFDPERGLRFDGDKVLLDPYGRALVVPEGHRRTAGIGPGRRDATAMKSIVADVRAYDWEGDRPLRRPYAQTVIYEAHVKGFTRHPSSGVAPERRGTYAGLVEKIPYLLDLGVTAVELLPVFHFDPEDAPTGRTNYWGYAPVSFFAPHGFYSARGGGLAALDEFRDMVKALHRAGLEVILDVVYNHTAEGDEHGPTFCFKGLANDVYYHLDPDDRARYRNYSGTGNTLDGSDPHVRRLVLDSLRYWVQEMHVDGFRFDLASIFARDREGRPQAHSPILFDIDTDPVLAGTKLIAEAWDAAGLYQVGSFVGDFWKEWNGKFRDDVRSFVRGDPGMVPALADRLLGSPELFAKEEVDAREPEQSINFVTCHDGFTLRDLVSYERKHNEANGEENRDGDDDNRSCNHGVEGPTADPAIEALRERQMKNLLAITLLSLGTPMLGMGDEIGRTQRGNNNAYCQDNELSWMDWTLLERFAGLRRFVREAIRIRGLRDHVRAGLNLTREELQEQAHIELHGVRLGEPDFGWESRSLALGATSLSGDLRMHFALNAWTEPLEFELPALPEGFDGWRRAMDTARPSPEDILPPREAPRVEEDTYRAAPRSVVALFAFRMPR
ncbi:MAG TPA: glycogen debranching protein GlgX [Polyangiaceae bacterium LLY-WYZ-15_(1-7)]|nr:glycogen debranching enzyme GlgX [Myxococcales bacterium]MAT25300.1 glycogen debranching enzyme GlgX [Sandaracinus sp.]HJK95086.1 glycogen debranching protein GlgX [Polyangiaceae bacterium LLY-WYZ-15_(1-7)]MBJ71373.1 glycogen debranching enzyme GlgX [Sandaracinus sp.]HJL06492.1 glycogen debranching protein GlgX [Polyangiaceae bacterium LLY-WYZ-15_(1-7)]